MTKARTTDERFILSLYDMARTTGEISTPCNCYEAGKRASIQPKGVNAICKLLVQANFIKKAGTDEVYLTKNGEDLALTLLSE